MAHFIAEQIKTAENTIGDEKANAEQRCFETILKLWKHRSSLPNGHNPFENFEPIFQTLERMNPDNEKTFYFHISKDDNINIKKDVQEWLDIALNIDQVARIWLSYIFEQAALCAADDNTSEWLRNSITIADHDDDIKIIVHLLPDDHLEDMVKKGKVNTKQIVKKKRELIASRIKQLESFNDFNQKLLLVLKQELEDLSK